MLMMPLMSAPTFTVNSPRILAHEQRCSVIYVPGVGGGAGRGLPLCPASTFTVFSHL
jgi:hypothetical protein